MISLHVCINTVSCESRTKTQTQACYLLLYLAYWNEQGKAEPELYCTDQPPLYMKVIVMRRHKYTQINKNK